MLMASSLDHLSVCPSTDHKKEPIKIGDNLAYYNL